MPVTFTNVPSATWKDDINDTTMFDQTCFHWAKWRQLFQRPTSGKSNMIWGNRKRDRSRTFAFS